MTWDEVVELDKWGYEPGIACDSKGTLYMTAHKDLDRKNTWDYLASWFFISKDGGKSWESPSEPFPRGEKWKTYAGDEGDIAIDGRDYVYFVDTYLTDNHIHVWANQGVYQYSVRIGRYWYYRSTNGARTFSRGTPIKGNGWAHIDAERRGTSPAPPSIYTSEAVRAITSAEVRLTHSSITPLLFLTASSRTTSRRASETPTTAGRR
ncbi:hypothetical protein B6U83_00690 [Thermoplasmatales archaeon ex4484_36]|nr:MAG: hypothetical protein B6U83_00690 [Thermoplasmatales archaeon ex4484_36]